MAAYERCGLLGERVIGLAFKEAGEDTLTMAAEKGQLQWHGLTAIVTHTVPAEARNPQEWGEACKAGEVLQDFVFTGLISLVDPPKVGVMEAVLEVSD